MPDNRPDPFALPQTLDELQDYIVRHADSICVHARINGKLTCCRLSDIPARDAVPYIIEWVIDFIQERRVPVRVLTGRDAETRRKHANRMASAGAGDVATDAEEDSRQRPPRTDSVN